MKMEQLSQTNQGSGQSIIKKFPFLKYTNQCILYHADQAEANDIRQRTFLEQTFLRSLWVKHRNAIQKHEIFRLLLDRNADVSAITNYEHTPLHNACIHMALETVKLLLGRNADISAVNKKGNTPLHEAHRYNSQDSIKITRLLLDYNANTSATNKHEETPEWSNYFLNITLIFRPLLKRGKRHYTTLARRYFIGK
jgi:ankyrin repeat protein